jgi:putative ABC transport system permease protein
VIWENVKLAFSDLRANKLRTALSLLGIVIGVMSVIVITTLGESASAGIQGNIAEAGLETITVSPGRAADGLEGFFTPELSERIRDSVSGVEAVVPVHQGQVRISYRGETLAATAVAAGPEYAAVFDWDPAEGSFVRESDELRARQAVVLGAETAEDLFPDGGAIDSIVRLFIGGQSLAFRVIGVMADKSASLGVSFNDRVIVPYSTFTRKISRPERVGSYVIATAPGEDVIAISENLESYLLAETRDENAFRVLSPSSIAEAFESVTATLNAFLAGIAAISLLVGGIGIMNIMLVAVAERTREIGIRKALGATPAAIRGQFLTEAIALTIIGGLIGVAAGTGIAALGVRLIDVPLVPATWAYGLSLGFSAGVGLFFGLYPAWRASRLDPVQALSYE